MRLSKAFWLSAVAGIISLASVVHAQTPASSVKAAPAAAPAAAGKPAEKAATAPGASAATPTPPGPVTTPATAAPAAATSATPTSAPAAGASSSPIDGSTYVVRLRDLEQHVDELKEQIRRSHTRLSLLSDTILSGGAGGARAEITFRNDLSSAFRLTGALFVLDGAVQYDKPDESTTPARSPTRKTSRFSLARSRRVITRCKSCCSCAAMATACSRTSRGIGSRCRPAIPCSFTEGKTVKLDVIAWEKGDVTTNLTDRPAIRFTETIRSGVANPGGPTPAAVPGAPASSNTPAWQGALPHLATPLCRWAREASDAQATAPER